MVEKDRFNYLLNNYNSLSQEETAELRLEQDHYGYCQVLHQLIARGDQDNQTEMKEQSLHIAAVYSTDRSVLKQVMTSPRVERTEPLPVSSEIKGEILIQPNVEQPTIPTVESTSEKLTPTSVIEEVKEPVSKVPKSDDDFDPDAALQKFIEDLKPMHEKKLQFEKAMEEFEMNIQRPTPIKSQTQEEKKGTKPKKRGRPKKADKETTSDDTSNSENLLNEIKTTKKKVSSESKKQKEQGEIIDQFIKTKPTISKPTGQQQQLDLTEQNESYNENVVSETLALILIKQGKKEKAIEVLRKLIWKFPQKKAYFAAQIEDLTK